MNSKLQQIATALQRLDALDAPPAPTTRRAPDRRREGALDVPHPTPPAKLPAASNAPSNPKAANAALPALPNRSGQGSGTLTAAGARSPLRFSRHQHSINPTLVTGLLAEMQSAAGRWQQDLQQILNDIQAVYLEGPIVEGWLESQPQSTDPQLIASIAKQYNSEVTCAGYRLCGFDAEGRIWSKACPPDQVPSVSMAIARYQKLRQLLERKHALEQRLAYLAEELIQTHSHLNSMDFSSS